MLTRRLLASEARANENLAALGKMHITLGNSTLQLRVRISPALLLALQLIRDTESTCRRSHRPDDTAR